MTTLSVGDPGWDANGSPAGESSRRDGIVEKLCRRSECGRTFAPGRPSQVYCSARCRTQAWDEKDPRVSPSNEKRQRAGSIWRAIFDEMARTQQWYTVQQLAEIVGALPASVSTRVRTEVKRHAERSGYCWLRDRLVGHASSAHRYRLVERETAA